MARSLKDTVTSVFAWTYSIILLALLIWPVMVVISMVIRPAAMAESHSSDILEGNPSIPTAGELLLPVERSMREMCLESENSCTMGAWNRTVKVMTARGQGTGFILRSDEKWMTVITAGHVIDADTSPESVEQLLASEVEDPESGQRYKAARACANRVKSFDSVLLLVPNFTGFRYPSVLLSDARAGESTIVVEFANSKRTAHNLPITRYNNPDKTFQLNGKLWPGASGSAVLSTKGDLIGTYVAIYRYFDLSIGSHEIDHFVNMRWPELRQFAEEPSSPILCSN